jgi:hypothetical protein
MLCRSGKSSGRMMCFGGIHHHDWASCFAQYFAQGADEIHAGWKASYFMSWECQTLHRMVDLASRAEFAGVP